MIETVVPNMDKESSDRLQTLRHDIDEIDQRLVALLNERIRCVMQVGELKRIQNEPIINKKREQEILRNVLAHRDKLVQSGNSSENSLTTEYLEVLYQIILEESKRLQGYRGE